MGFRPLVLGQKGEAYAVASETCAFDLIGAEYIREIEPGEILVINKEGLKSYDLNPYLKNTVEMKDSNNLSTDKATKNDTETVNSTDEAIENAESLLTEKAQSTDTTLDKSKDTSQTNSIAPVNSTGTATNKPKKKAQCIFEYVYFSRPDSLVFNKSVYEQRKKMGEYLAKEYPVEADIVIPVPDSGIPAAIAYSQATGIPYEMGIIRNHYIGRTFIQPSPLIRNFKVKIKLNPQNLVKGKRVVAVDDSIVRGTTSKALIEILKSAGAKEVHLRVSSPPIKGPCYYGVDTPKKKQLISGQKQSIEEIRQFIGADSLAYLSYESLLKIGSKKDFCLACFDEEYPTPLYN